MRILVCDDSLTMRRIIIDTLKSIGDFDIVEADSAEGAREILYHNQDIGLMLLDFHLPGMSGLELLQKLKQDTRTAAVPVVMITSEREKAHVIAALRAGAKNYIVKPFTQQVFRKKVGDLLDAPPEAETRAAGRLVGSIGQTSPLEVVQLISMTKKTGVLEFDGNGQRYQIFFRQGQIDHAAGEGVSGEEAFIAASGLSEGVFTFRTEVPDHPVSVRRATDMIMIDAASRFSPGQ